MRAWRLATAAVLSLAFWQGACTRSGQTAGAVPLGWTAQDRDRYLALQTGFDGQRRVRMDPDTSAATSKAMIAGTSDPFAIHAGLLVLKHGGHAADAALTTAIAQVALNAGQAVSYAGVLMAVYYDAATGQVSTLNAGWNTIRDEHEPATIPPMGQHSGRTALVPGFMAGVQALYDRFGHVPFATLFDPAIWVAEHGVRLSPIPGYMVHAQEKFITRLPETKRVFTKGGGALYTIGDTFPQPDLATTLRRVAKQGAGYMYTGEWAQHFVQTVQHEGGKVTLDDLAAYRALWTAPLRMPYRDQEIVSMGSPSTGGLQTLGTMKLVEVADLKHYGHYTRSVDALYFLTQMTRVERLLANESPATLAHELPGVDASSAARLTDDTAHRLWNQIQEPTWHAPLWPVRGSGSNHSGGVVAVDELGNVAVILHSCNCVGWGTTGMFVEGVSIPDAASFQQPLIAASGPGARLPDGTNPLIVLANGKPVLASTTIGVALLDVTVQNLINVLDFGMDPTFAVSQANTQGPFYGLHMNEPLAPEIDQETIGAFDLPANLIDGLRARGQAVKLISGEQQMGYWIGIAIDPKTQTRRGAVTTKLPAMVEGY